MAIPRTAGTSLVWFFLRLSAARAEEEDLSCPVGDQACSAALREGDRPYYWPQQKGDVNRTGWSPYTATFDVAAGPTWSWQSPLTVNRHTPLIDDKRNIHITTMSGVIYKFSHSGELLWQHNTGYKIPAVPAIMDGSIFYNRADGFVSALDMETAHVKWETQISNRTGSDTACVFALDGLVISATNQFEVESWMQGENNAVVALHAANGSHAWTFQHKFVSFNFQASSPGDGTMIFQDRFGAVYKLSLSDGSLIWESGVLDRHQDDFTTGAAVVGPNGLVYAASNYRTKGIIHAYRLEDGKQVWRVEVGMPVNQAVAVGVLAGSDRLSVVTGVGENPGFPASLRALPLFFLILMVLPFILCCRCCVRLCRRKRIRCCRSVLFYLAAVLAAVPLLLGYHYLSLQAKTSPLFFGGREQSAAMVALDAETGETRWTYNPPSFAQAACDGDAENFLPLLYNLIVLKDPGDPICLPDNWAQTVIDGAGTTYGGHQDGYLYAIRDADGSGTIDPVKEVSRYYMGSAFQASQSIAPNMLAAMSCGSRLAVWKS